MLRLDHRRSTSCTRSLVPLNGLKILFDIGHVAFKVTWVDAFREPAPQPAQPTGHSIISNKARSLLSSEKNQAWHSHLINLRRRPPREFRHDEISDNDDAQPGAAEKESGLDAPFSRAVEHQRHGVVELIAAVVKMAFYQWCQGVDCWPSRHGRDTMKESTGTGFRAIARNMVRSLVRWLQRSLADQERRIGRSP